MRKPSIDHLLPPSVEHFPFDVFPQSMADSFRQLSKHHNIPLDFMGCAALFTIGALSGNMYRGDMNGGIKPINYMILIGPSSVGKSPAFSTLCMDVIGPLRAREHAKYKEKRKQWDEDMAKAKVSKQAFTEPEPVKKIRMIEDATLEAITKYAEITPAGFGIFYDEGGRLFNGVNQYKKDNSSIDFWNEMWYGKSKEIIRADATRDRYIENAGVSIMMGMQKDRLLKYMDKDTMDSGIMFRFLMVESDYIELNENVDPFAPSVYPCREWTELVEYLFDRGVSDFFDPKSPLLVPFTREAKQEITRVIQDNLRASNVMIRQKHRHEENSYLMAYNGKISAYVARLALILSIADDPRTPQINQDHILGAEKLYQFFKTSATKILTRVKAETISGLTDKEQSLLDMLPVEFSTQQAAEICKATGLNDKFFLNTFRRKYRPLGFVTSKNKGFYIKA